MKKIIIAIYLVLFSTVAIAQKASVAIGYKAGKVQIKFLFPDRVMSDYSINIYRKTQGGSWEKITTSQVTRASLTENNNDEEYKTYKAYMTRKPQADKEDENNAQAFAGLMIIDNNTFAKYAGCYYEDAGATVGNTYQYRITDAKNGDKELAVSDAFTVKENYLPQVSGITAKQTKQDVNLDWKEGDVFFAYNIYRKINGKSVKITPQGIMIAGIEGAAKPKGDEVKHTDSSVAEGAVEYEVTGIDVLGNESQPASVKISVKDMLPPTMVKNVKGKREKEDAVITWDAIKSSDVKGYNIYRNNSKDTVYKKITTTVLSASTITYTDKQLKEGTVYGYKVESVDDAGNGTLSWPAKVFFADQAPPAQPTGLKAVTKPGVVQLTWDKNKEGDLKGYYIYRASNRNRDYFNMLYRYPVTTNSFNDTLPGVAKNEFVYYIQAVDKNYNVSVPSDTVITTLPDTTAPIMPIIRDGVYNNSSITLQTELRDEDAATYDVYRSDDSANGKNYKKVNSAPVTAATYTDRVENKGQAYHYYIISKDQAGNASEQSQKYTVYVDRDIVVAIPTDGLKGKYNAADTAVALSWNTAKNANGYMVYRKEGESFKPVSEVINQTSFTDKPVEAGGTYQYRIRTFYTDAEEAPSSAEISVNAY